MREEGQLILLTGATGYVGGRLLATLESDGRAVREAMGNNAPVRWTVMGIRDA